jgi:hypothetical protein
MTQRRWLYIFAVLTAAIVSAGAALPAAGAADGQRCCFFLKADGNSEVNETFEGDTPRGKQRGSVAWRLVGIFRYVERGGFSDLVKVSPAHEHGIRFTEDNIRHYSQLQDPPDTVGRPAADPGACGVFERKRIERHPRVDLFRGNVSVYTRAYEDRGCMYGISMINWSVNGTPTGGFSPWGDEFRAPNRNFFRNGRGTYRRQTGFTSNYSPLREYGVETSFEHTGFMTIEWFPARALDRRRKEVRNYHEGYKFKDLCSEIPAAC